MQTHDQRAILSICSVRGCGKYSTIQSAAETRLRVVLQLLHASSDGLDFSSFGGWGGVWRLQVLLPHQAMCFLQAVHPKHAQRIQSTLSAKRAMSETTPLALSPSTALARGGATSLLGDPGVLSLPQAAPPAAAHSGLQGLLCAGRPDSASSIGNDNNHSNHSNQSSSLSALQALQAQFGSGHVAPPAAQSNNALPWLHGTLSGLSGDSFSGLSLGGSVSRSGSEESVQRQISSGLAALLHQGQSSSPQMHQRGATGWQQQLDQFALQLKHQHQQQPNTQQASQFSPPAASELHAQLAAMDPAALKNSLSMLLPQGSGSRSQLSGGWK